jgi:hypothetical protein
MYRTKEYVERPWEEIKSEIDLVANVYPEMIIPEMIPI